MNIMRALLWKEWRSIQREALLLAGIGAAWSIAWRIVPEVSLDVALITAATFLLPGAALLLGASTTAGDGALSFASARPAGRAIGALARVAVRLATLAANAAVSVMLFVAVTPEALGRLAAQMPGQSEIGWMLLALSAFLVACFAAAALVSAFVERPLAAVFVGVAIVALLWAGGEWLLGDMLNEPVLLGAAAAIAACVLLVIAVAATLMRSGDAPVPPRAGLRVAVIALVAVALVAVGWPLAATGVAKIRMAEAERELAAAIPAYATLEERHPPRTKPNETQVKLEAAAAALGIDTRRLTWGSASGPFALPEFAAWERAQLESPQTLITPPPAGLQEWLDARADALAALRAVLASEELPLSRQPGIHDPGAFSQAAGNSMMLARILNADAFAAIGRGPEFESLALADLDAEWRLAEALAAHPELINQLYALAIASRVTRTLRKLSQAPEGWDERLTDDRWRASFAEGLLFDAARLGRRASMGGDAEPWWWKDRPLIERWAEGPLHQFDNVAYVRAMGAAAQVVGSGRCASYPQGDPEARGPATFTPSYVARINRLRLQMELTRATFAVRRARAADPAGAWPSAMPSIVASACEEMRLVYTPGDVPAIQAEGDGLEAIARIGIGVKSMGSDFRVELH